MLDGLDLFPSALIDAVRVNAAAEIADSTASARAVKIAARVLARRAKSEAVLREVLPSRIEPGDSWHVVSHGDVDSLSFLAHAIDGVSYFDYVAISTWCMAHPDLETLSNWLDSGKIDRLDLFVGEIFPSQYSAEFSFAMEMARLYGVRVVVARNHSKVMLMADEKNDYFLVVESSANVNTNPRIEQTSVTNSADLYRFYKEFFAGLKTIDRRAA